MVLELENKDGELDPKAVNALLDRVADEDREDEPVLAENKQRGDEKIPPVAKAPSSDKDDDSVADRDDGLDWFSADDARDLIESLGLTQEDVSAFSGRDEFDRHVRLLDKQFLREGKKPGDDQDAALEAADRERKVEQQRERASEQPRDKGKFAKQDAAKEELALDPNEFDDRLVEVFGRASERIKQLEARIQQLDQREAESQHMLRLRQFDSIVDQLGHDDLFGRSDELDAGSDEFKARSQLWDTLGTLVAGMNAKGKSVADPITKAMVLRALNAEFSEKLQQKQRRSFGDRVRKQAGKRFGGGSQRTQAKQYTGPLERDPDLLAAYDAMLAEAD